MVEFDVDMGYLLSSDELDKVVLNDENGEHESMEFVPKDDATVVRSCASCPEMDNPDSYIFHLHSALEAADKSAGTCKDLGGIGADGEVVFHCSECGCVLSLFDKDGRNNLCTSFIYDYPRFCPECGRRCIG